MKKDPNSKQSLSSKINPIQDIDSSPSTNKTEDPNESVNNSTNGTSKFALAALSAVPILMVLGNSMLIPEFPKIKSALDINQFQVGLLITLFSASAGIAIPLLGFLSDQYGRKMVIIPSTILYGVGGVISGLGAISFGGSYSIILAGRVVQGIGAAGTAPIVMAMVGDLYKSNARSEAMGIIEAANGMGKVLSPILGAAVALISWWALFFSYAILAVPIALGIWFLTQEPTHDGEKQQIGAYFKKIVQIFQEKGPSLLVSLLSGMVVLFILFGVLSHISDVLEKDFDLRGLVKGLIIAIPIFIMSLSSFLTGRFLKTKGTFFKLAMVVGLSTVAGALILLPFFNNPYIYIGILAIMGLGTGFVLPSVNTLVTSATAAEQRGGVTSLYGSVRFIGVAIGPPTFSLMFQYGEKAMFWFGTGVALAVAGLVLFLLKEEKLAPEGGSEDDGQIQKQNEKTTVIGLNHEEKKSIFNRKNRIK